MRKFFTWCLAMTLLAATAGCRYFESDARPLSAALRRMCADEGIGYVPLHAGLRAAEEGGRAPRWKRDGHFNEVGNEVFAETLRAWLARSFGIGRDGVAPAADRPVRPVRL